MEGNKTVHYKKQFVSYVVTTYNDSIPVDFYSDIVRSPFKSNKIPKYGYFIEGKRQIVDKDVFLKHYGDKSVSVSSESITIVIEEYDNKISMKYYFTTKSRRVGGNYFRYGKDMSYITYNLKTKNIYVGDVDKKNKRLIRKNIMVNCFGNRFLSSFRLHIRRFVRDMTYSDMNYVSNVRLGDTISDEIIKVYLRLLEIRSGILIDKEKSGDTEIFKFYLDHNGFKYPDTFKQYINVKLSKRELKKYGNVVTLLTKKLKLGGKKVKRILNSVNDIDLSLITNLYHLLGVDYFNKLEDFVLISKDSSSITNLGRCMDYIENSTKFTLSNNDKLKIVNVLNSNLRWGLLFDHLLMIYKLKKEHGYDFKMRFTDRDSFNSEHYELSKLLESYSKGQITRNYGDFFKEKVEEVLYGMDGVEYHPILLLTTNDYNDESAVQNNCVRTYVEKPQSLIISLREGSCDSKERATIEYRFRRNEMIRTQSLGRYNKDLSPRYDTVLEILDDKVRSLYKQDILHLPRMVKEYKSGKKICRKAEFINELDEDLLNNINPVWDNHEDKNDDFFDFELFF